ncbi:hypothetical protein DMI60_09370 [Escherichia coli]|nr:hypothetical protein [Escherichia coli]
MKLINVTRTPPNLSEIAPPTDRAMAPINGPKNAGRRIFTSGNWVLPAWQNPQKTDKRTEGGKIKQAQQPEMQAL